MTFEEFTEAVVANVSAQGVDGDYRSEETDRTKIHWTRGCLVVTMSQINGKVVVSYIRTPATDAALMGHSSGAGLAHSLDADGVTRVASEVVAKLSDRYLYE
jgi:hypothetical protein